MVGDETGHVLYSLPLILSYYRASTPFWSPKSCKDRRNPWLTSLCTDDGALGRPDASGRHRRSWAMPSSVVTRGIYQQESAILKAAALLAINPGSATPAQTSSKETSWAFGRPPPRNARYTTRWITSGCPVIRPESPDTRRLPSTNPAQCPDSRHQALRFKSAELLGRSRSCRPG